MLLLLYSTGKIKNPPTYLHPAEVQSMCVYTKEYVYTREYVCVPEYVCIPGQSQQRSSMEYTKYSSFEYTSVEYVYIQGRRSIK